MQGHQKTSKNIFCNAKFATFLPPLHSNVSVWKAAEMSRSSLPAFQGLCTTTTVKYLKYQVQKKQMRRKLGNRATTFRKEDSMGNLSNRACITFPYHLSINCISLQWTPAYSAICIIYTDYCLKNLHGKFFQKAMLHLYYLGWLNRSHCYITFNVH